MYRDTFHDLNNNNNNRYLKDCFDAIRIMNYKHEDVIDNSIESIFEIFSNHKSNIEKIDNETQRIEFYKKEITSIEEITRFLLSEKYLSDSVFRNLKRNLEFIDYRIRYMNRIVNSDSGFHKENNLKKLNITKIFTKLKYVFLNTTKKKSQQIKVNTYEYDNIYVKGYDDLYLAFFILLENSVKYAHFDTVINVNFSRNLNKVTIVIDNESDYISNIDLLTERGVQGDNKKDGNGFGLSIAKDIFSSSNCEFSIDYINNKFYCTITAEVVNDLK